MATINKKAISEILDYDAQINRRAFNATKKQVKNGKMRKPNNPRKRCLPTCSTPWTASLEPVRLPHESR